MRTRVLIAAGVLLVAAAAVAGVVVALGHGGKSAANRVVVDDSSCGTGWAPPAAGRTVFTIENRSPTTIFAVQLTDAKDASIFGSVHTVAPSAEVPMDVVLPPGTYAFRCQASSGYALMSPAEQVEGATVAAHPFPEVQNTELYNATLQYQASVKPVLARLQTDTDRLNRAVQAGRLAAARTLWLPAHLDYATLGAAYGTFGDLNDAIDGTPFGLQGGVHSKDFKGFLRLEYGLWHGQPAAVLKPVAAALDRSVHTLVRRFPWMQVPAGDLSLRTHEILENSLQFELTGETDEGSHTNLATAWANVRGTDLTLAAIRPILAHTDRPLLESVTAGLKRLSVTLATYRSASGGWTSLHALTTRQREALDSATSGLLERLEQIPDRLEPLGSLRTVGGDD